MYAQVGPHSSCYIYTMYLSQNLTALSWMLDLHLVTQVRHLDGNTD